MSVDEIKDVLLAVTICIYKSTILRKTTIINGKYYIDNYLQFFCGNTVNTLYMKNLFFFNGRDELIESQIDFFRKEY